MNVDWRALGSVRALFGALLVALIPACLASLVWSPLFWIVGGAVFGAWMYNVQMRRAWYCPNCAKRVKAGASACHHCGLRL